MKLDDAAFSEPPAGPAKVKLEAGAAGVTEDAADAGLVPYAFVAVTEQVYAVP